MQRIIYRLQCVSLLAFFLCRYPAYGQDTLVDPQAPKTDTVDYYEMSIEQLQKLKASGVPSELEKLINSLIGVASIKPLSGRESPSIVSLITEEEIKSAGARDLMDVLGMVPGFDFAMDVEGVVGLGMRGNWAHEGKILLLVDGQEMNEALFGTTQYGNHLPVDQIRRVEIIRGPGSAIYGGYAEYGVINIITHEGDDINGFLITGTYGQMQKTYARRNVSLEAGKKFGQLQMSLAGMLGEGTRSDRDYSDFFGNSYNLAGNSRLDPVSLNAGLSWKGLNVRFLHDLYKTTTGDDYDVLKAPYPQSFSSTFAEIKYKFKIGKKFTVTPRFNYKEQVPWKTPADSTTDEYFKITHRYTGNITCSYNINRKMNVIFGGEIFSDAAKDMADSSYFSTGEKEIVYLNEAAFIQGVLKFRFVNFILGARYDNHSAYGSAFSPRVGLTKKLGHFHFKLLYSNSFRAPSIENINLQDSTGITAEKTNVAELEVGYEIRRNSIITLNLFDLYTNDAIVYYYDAVNDMDAYHNIGSTGSSGVELEYKLKDTWGFLNLNYSFYSSGGKNRIPDYEVPGNSSVQLAFPAHKANLGASFNVGNHFSINPSLSYKGERYGYVGLDTAGNSVIGKYDAAVYVNLYLRYKNFLVKGLDIGVGVYNLFDEEVQYIQPYNSNHAALPGVSRELLLKLSYGLQLKRKGE
jgi:outer membrane cobalamin receptor